MAKIIRTNEKTPAGGDYSEMVFLNDKLEVVDEKVATRCVIRECKKDGTLIQETWGSLARKRNRNHP